MEFVRVCYKFIHAAKKYSLDYSILVFIVQIGILLFFCCDSLQKSALKKRRHYTIKKNAPVNVSCHLLHLSLNKQPIVTLLEKLQDNPYSYVILGEDDNFVINIFMYDFFLQSPLQKCKEPDLRGKIDHFIDKIIFEKQAKLCIYIDR